MTTGKKITGNYPDNLNFPDNLIPNTSQISELQKNLLNSGALDLVDHTDPFGRSCKAYAGFRNPHDDAIQQIAQKIADQKSALPDNWDHVNYAQRVEVKSLTVIAICPRTKKNFDPTGNVFIPCVLLLTQISCFIIDDYYG